MDNIKYLRSEESEGSLRNNIETAKEAGIFLLTLVVKVSDALPPLKAVSSGLHFVIEHIEKIKDVLGSLQGLTLRLDKIDAMLSSESYAGCENKGLEELQRELGDVAKTLETVKRRSRLRQLFMARNDAARMKEYIIKVERALFDYQLSLTQDLYAMNLAQLSYDELATLDRLVRASDAAFDASDDRPRCLEGTRVDIIQDLGRWALMAQVRQIYWLHGLAGSGKSTIAQSFAELLLVEHKLGASFFCSRDSQQRCDLRTIFPTLAFQLARANNPDSPKFRSALLRTLRVHPDIASSSLAKQLDHLLVAPAQESKITTVIVIDALDECKDERATSIILELLSKRVHTMPTIKFFVTSRPEFHIRSGFRLPSLKPVTEVMVLQEVGETSVHGDIKYFLQRGLTSIAASRSDLDLSDEWPNEHDIDSLTHKASGLFIFASTALKYIGSGEHDPKVRLRELLDEAATSQGGHLNNLDELYRGITHSACKNLDEDSLQRLRSILGLLVVANDPLCGPTIAEILCISWPNVKTSLRPMHSLLTKADSCSQPIRFCHKSFPDFLIDPKRCIDKRILVHGSLCNFEAAKRCFALMERYLKKNICCMPRYSRNSSLDYSVMEQNVGKALQYSCRYWADHMLLIEDSCTDNLRAILPLLHHFLTTHQLHWFEVLGLLQEVWRANQVLKDIIQWLHTNPYEHEDLSAWAMDGLKFVLCAFDLINHSVAHIYHSALPLAPETSLLKRAAWEHLETEVRILAGTRLYWSDHAHLRTLYPKPSVEAIQFSPDGSTIAAYVRRDGGYASIHLYRPTTGEKLSILHDMKENPAHGHRHTNILTFSSDNGTLAASTEGGRCVAIWDVCTRASIPRLDPPTSHKFHTLAFHPNANHLLLCGMVDTSSTGYQQAVLMFDMHTHNYHYVYSQEQDVLYTLPLCWLCREGETSIVIGSVSGETSIWHVNPPVRTKVLMPPQCPSLVSAVASSADGSLVASCFQNRRSSIVVWNMGTGEPLYCLHDFIRMADSLRFIPAGPSQRPLLSFSSRSGLYILRLGSEDPANATTDGRVARIKFHVLANGHGRVPPGTAQVSPHGSTLAVPTLNGTVELWDTSRVPELSGWGQGSHNHKRLDHDNTISLFSNYSPDAQCKILGFTDNTIRVYSSDTRIHCNKFRTPLTAPTSTMSPDDIRVFWNNTLMVYYDTQAETVFLWDLTQNDSGPSQVCFDRSVPSCQEESYAAAYYTLSEPPHSCHGIGFICVTTTLYHSSDGGSIDEDTEVDNAFGDEDTLLVQCWTIDTSLISHQKVTMFKLAEGFVPFGENCCPAEVPSSEFPLRCVLPPSTVWTSIGTCILTPRSADQESHRIPPLLPPSALLGIRWTFICEEWLAAHQEYHTPRIPISLKSFVMDPTAFTTEQLHPELEEHHPSVPVTSPHELVEVDSQPHLRKIKLIRQAEGTYATVLRLPVKALRWADFDDVGVKWDTADRLCLSLRYPHTDHTRTGVIVDFAGVNLNNNAPF